MKNKIIILLLALSLGHVLAYELDNNENSYYSTDDYTQIDNSTDVTNTTTRSRPNYCQELFPYCTCYFSPAIVKCSEFTRLTQLDFSLLNNDSYLRNRTLEFELAPINPLSLDNSLDLSELSFDKNAKIILRNIDGFDLLDASFYGLREDNKLFLYIYNSTIKTTKTPCNWNLLPPDYDGPGLFAAFDYILFGDGLIYTDTMCPIVFYRANISLIEAYYMTPTNYLRFSTIENAPANLDLLASVYTFKISFAPDFVIKSEMLNRYVFGNLAEINVENIRLAEIKEDAFTFTQKLKRIFLTLENVEQFIRSSDNKWMFTLNEDVVVDYSNQTSIDLNQARSLVIQVNSRNSATNYLYPDEDFIYFQYFPYDRMVFYRILTEMNINCTSTMGFLLQNALYYDPPSYLNTTSAYKCLLVNTTIQSSTTRVTASFSSVSSSSSSGVVSSTEEIATSSKQTVPLTTFLAVVIPLAVVSILGLLCILFLSIKLCQKPKNAKKDVELSKF